MSTVDEHRVVGRVLAPEIGELIAARRNHEARRALNELLEPEIADVLAELEPRTGAIAFRLLPREVQADVYVLLDAELQRRLLEELKDEQLANLFDEIDPDDRAELFEEMPGRVVRRLLKLMSPEERRRTRIILGYPEDSVGRLMTPEYLTVRAEWTARRALEQIRRKGREAESIDTVYVVDRSRRLISHLRFSELFFADPKQRVEELVERQTPALWATEDREEAVRAMERYDVPMLPVVDRDNVMVGVVTFDDVADVAAEEMTEDMQKMGGMEALDRPYVSASVVELVRKRGVWLAVLFCGSLLTVTAMGAFEESLKEHAILALFVPLIIASGGNSGSQAATMMIRSLALGEVRLSDWLSVCRKELLSGLMLGTLLGLLGLVVGTVVAMWFFREDAPGMGRAAIFGFAIGTALVGVVLIGTISGSMLPFALQRLGVDPATSSTPFVATIADVAGLLVYFVTATVILNLML